MAMEAMVLPLSSVNLALHLRKQAAEHAAVFDEAVEALESELISLAEVVALAMHTGHKLLICGNGGSASDALHIAAEFVGRFEKERAGLPAIALTADSSILTAVGNDYGFERVFARQVEALGQQGDVLLAISTSGTSKNVLAALEVAKAKNMHTVLFTGVKGAASEAASQVLAVPSAVTARIQEVHIFLLHLLTEFVERLLVAEPLSFSEKA